jgi:hypothetical protein
LHIYSFVPNGWLQGDYIAVMMPRGKDGAPVSVGVGNNVTGNEKGKIAGFIGVDGHVYPEEFLKVYAFTLLRTVRPIPVRPLPLCGALCPPPCAGTSVSARMAPAHSLTTFIGGHRTLYFVAGVL